MLFRTQINSHLPLIVALAMWFVYAIIFALYLPEPWASLIGFLPGVVATSFLLKSGASLDECYLRFQWPSMIGLVVLGSLFVPMIPVVIMGFKDVGWAEWDWIIAILYAPASGAAQELYFRSGLLPALELTVGQRRNHALVFSSILFALFHAGMFLVAPAGAAVSALVVTFIVGLGWGWQVQHDRTVVWAIIHHTILQIILRFFAWM